MQTFLPYDDFYKSAACLDVKRCWKQTVEAYQIINVLTADRTTKYDLSGNPIDKKKIGWYNHPAVRMWKGYVAALICYYNVFYTQSVNFWGIKTVKLCKKVNVHADTPLPWWFGLKEFHDSHKSNLLRKKFDFYSKYSWNVPIDLPYFWPVNIDGSKNIEESASGYATRFAKPAGLPN